ncbi:unnamed protein product [Schistocephalus solidus]|uniref:Uncharacterized protein n=1 Tax=Schistocephalus solidus TaxID=70667 RepID=A0A183T6B2_SCHSO|nr:unnamed protein product [Schistocephalus solidus]
MAEPFAALTLGRLRPFPRLIRAAAGKCLMTTEVPEGQKPYSTTIKWHAAMNFLPKPRNVPPYHYPIILTSVFIFCMYCVFIREENNVKMDSRLSSSKHQQYGKPNPMNNPIFAYAASELSRDRQSAAMESDLQLIKSRSTNNPTGQQNYEK